MRIKIHHVTLSKAKGLKGDLEILRYAQNDTKIHIYPISFSLKGGAK